MAVDNSKRERVRFEKCRIVPTSYVYVYEFLGHTPFLEGDTGLTNRPGR